MHDHTDKARSPLPPEALRADSILVYGGTFDPPHRAHVELPALTRQHLGVELLLYVPAAVSPFKQDATATPAEHRLAMLRLALADRPRTAIWPVEIEAGGVHYTVDTLELLRARVGEATRLHLLVGSDQARQFHRWRDAQRILQLSHPAVMLRPPDTRAALRAALAERWTAGEVERWLCAVVEVPMLDIAATELRARLARGEDVSGTLPNPVAEYITTHRLYES